MEKKRKGRKGRWKESEKGVKGRYREREGRRGDGEYKKRG